jgi:hypothetical protein
MTEREYEPINVDWGDHSVATAFRIAGLAFAFAVIIVSIFWVAGL